MLALCRRSTATAAIAAKTMIGHGSPSASATNGQRDAGHHRRQRGVAGDEEDDEPDRDPDQPEQRRDAEERPAPGGDRLAALLEAEEERPPVAEHRRAAGEHADQLADEERADERGHEALGDVEHDDRDPVALPYVRQTLLAPMLPLPTLRMSSPLTSRTTQYPNGIDPSR